MQTAIIFQEFLPTHIAEYSLTANLVVTQTSPLICYKRNTNVFYNYSGVVDSGNLADYQIGTIIGRYSKRNSKLKN